jgi:hypothetical protein
LIFTVQPPALGVPEDQQMRIALAIVPVLFSPLLAAQSTAVNNSTQFSLPSVVTYNEGCPVSISVRRDGHAAILDAVRPGQSSSRSQSAAPNANQGLGVTIIGGHGAIKSLDLVVYGMDAGMHIVPAARNTQEIEENVRLSVLNGQGRKRHADRYDARCGD